MTSKQIWVALTILVSTLIWYLIKPDYKLLNESGSRYVWRINETNGEVCKFEVVGGRMKTICGGNFLFEPWVSVSFLRSEDAPAVGAPLKSPTTVLSVADFEKIPVANPETSPSVKFEDIPIEETPAGKQGAPQGIH